MPSSCPSEERFPLLLLFLEDGQQSSKHRRILIDKTRYQGITSGASAVITQWPGHITACWLTALVIGFAIILVTMTMFAFALRPGAYLLTARCRNAHILNKENHTAFIHLVHGPTPWMQSQLDALEEIAQNYRQFHIDLIIIQNEINFVDNSKNKNKALTQPGYYQEQRHVEMPIVTEEDVHINSTTPLPTIKSSKVPATSPKATTAEELKRVKRIKRHLKRKTGANRKKKLYPWENIQFNINIGTKKLLRMLLNRKIFEEPLLSGYRYKHDMFRKSTKLPLTYGFQDLIKMYPNIHVKNLTYERAFKKSPLYLYWHNLNTITRLFAIRVLQMWNFAGITFDLPEFPKTSEVIRFSINTTLAPTSTTSANTSNVQKTFIENERKYEKLIVVGLPSFEELPEGLVTVDDNGLHMETKTVCHAFFGEMLINFKAATIETMPEDIIKKTLRTFCKRGSVDTEYCKIITT